MTEAIAPKKYNPLTNEEKYSVREAQFQITHAKELAKVSIQNAENILRVTVDNLAKDRGIKPEDKTEFHLVDLDFVDIP